MSFHTDKIPGNHKMEWLKHCADSRIGIKRFNCRKKKFFKIKKKILLMNLLKLIINNKNNTHQLARIISPGQVEHTCVVFLPV